MNNIFLPLLLVMACALGVLADETDRNETQPPDNQGWNMDDFQDYWSRKLLIFSSNLDQMFSDGMEEDDANLSAQSDIPDSVSLDGNRFPKPRLQKKNEEETYETSSWFDDFFKDETYLDSANRSYVRIRGGYEYDKRGDSSVFSRVTARIRLPKTEEKLQLFIGDDAEEKATATGIPATEKNEGVGLKYFLPALRERFFTNASIGFSGIDNPYVKAHIEYPVFLQSWLFKTAQTFKYSVEDHFDEWTDLYFDRKLSDKEMFRLMLQRSTNSEIPGMEYFAQLSYRNTLKHGIGFNYYLALSGRTKDLARLPYENGTIPQEGVFEYAAGMIWRQPLLKQYLFYQIEPVLSYHEQYDFQPNYLLRLTLDLYFGNTK